MGSKFYSTSSFIYSHWLKVMARIKTFKNFVTPVECAELNAWVEQGVMRRWLDLGRNENAKRLTTRMYGERFVYPNLAYKISKRI